MDEDVHGGNYLVQITPVNSSDLSPVDPVVVLAQATIADSSIPTNGLNQSTEVEADFANPPAVNAGGEYAIVVKRPGDPNGVGIGFKSNPHPDPCPDGALYHSSDDSTAWSAPLAGDDAVFTTFVTGPPAPVSPSPLQHPTPTTHKKCKKSRKSASAAKKKQCKKAKK